MIRVRLKFDSTPVSYAQKCWFTFDAEKCRLVSDVSHLIGSHFSLQSVQVCLPALQGAPGKGWSRPEIGSQES